MIKFLKRNWLIILILLLGIFLRYFRLKQDVIFNGEVGFDYLSIKNFLVNHEIPLAGPPTSHPWFKIAPLFYWLFMVVLPIGNFSPVFGSYFMAGIGVLTLIVGYAVIKRLFGRKVSLISTFLMAISPSFLYLTRNARFNSFTALLFFPYFYYLVKSTKDKGRSLFKVGLFLGLMLSFFPSPFVLFPAAVVTIFVYRGRFRKKEYLNGLLGLILPNIAYLIFMVKDRFNMLIQIALWIPYRILGFLGFIPKNNADQSVISSNFTSLYDFFRNSILPEQNNLYLFIFFILAIFLVYKFTKEIRKGSEVWTTTLVVFVVSYFGLFLHGNPPLHYYLVVFPLPIIFFSVFLVFLLNHSFGKYIVGTILLLIVLVNFKYDFSEQWFYIPENSLQKGEYPVPLALQKKVAGVIVNDAMGLNYELTRVGKDDKFENNFADNYVYLLWLMGNEPVKKAGIKYTIYEIVPDNLPRGKVFELPGIKIVKEEI